MREEVDVSNVVPAEEDGATRFHGYVESLAQTEDWNRMGFYPGLSSERWFNSGDFPLAIACEDEYLSIRRELLALDDTGFREENEKIARTGAWGVFFLFERGRKNVENCSRCPYTTRLIESHRAIRTSAGLAYFSRMSPGSRIAPHRGPTNVRVRCHLGIQIPEGDCGLQVDNEIRGWNEGKCLIFNDYLRHESWNNTSSERIVLVVDLWHPELTSREVLWLEGLHRYVAAQANNLSRYWAVNSQWCDAG
jgi:aspartyl/asparaginyl beta-hydroxylase (cupin superfamily)